MSWQPTGINHHIGNIARHCIEALHSQLDILNENLQASFNMVLVVYGLSHRYLLIMPRE
jgi:hypothetical protein